MFSLDSLQKIAKRTKKRLGRGTGSGKGNHTVGRGTKGQTSRVGRGVPLWFEGGQLPLLKRLPFLRGKLRFGSLNVKPQLVSLSTLSKLNVQEITPTVLHASGYVKNVQLPVKIVGTGEVKKAYMLHGVQITKKAKALIEKAGGKID